MDQALRVAIAPLISVECAMRIEPSPRQAAGNLHRKDENRFMVRSLTPPQAARNVLTIAVQGIDD